MEHTAKQKMNLFLLLLKIANCLMGIVALTIFGSSIYLWIQTSANNLVLALFFLGISMIIVIIFGFTSIKKNSTSTALYMIMIIIVTVAILFFGLFLIISYKKLIEIFDCKDLEDILRLVHNNYYIGEIIYVVVIIIISISDIILCKIYRQKAKRFEKMYLE